MEILDALINALLNAAVYVLLLMFCWSVVSKPRLSHPESAVTPTPAPAERFSAESFEADAKAEAELLAAESAVVETIVPVVERSAESTKPIPKQRKRAKAEGFKTAPTTTATIARNTPKANRRLTHS